MAQNYAGVSHPCDDCGVEASFLIPLNNSDTKKSGTLVHEDGDVEYWREVKCEDCGVWSTHGGVYNYEWYCDEI